MPLAEWSDCVVRCRRDLALRLARVDAAAAAEHARAAAAALRIHFGDAECAPRACLRLFAHAQVWTLRAGVSCASGCARQCMSSCIRCLHERRNPMHAQNPDIFLAYCSSF